MKKIRDLSNRHRKQFGFAVLLILLCVMTCLFDLFLYQYDNKYFLPVPSGKPGQIDLRNELNESAYTWLIDGWEFYSGVLLSPKDFQNDNLTPDRHIYIGQYGGLEAVDGHPHGSATYRLSILLPDEVRSYWLFLPEIYSAHRLYINGVERFALGNPDPEMYMPRTAETMLSFEAGEQVELVIAVSDFSRGYSGIVYPPALGNPDALQHFMTSRMVLRAAVLTLTAVVALLALLMFFSNRREPLSLLFALMCLFFFGYTAYPVVRVLTSGFQLYYFVENFCFCCMLLMVLLIQRRLLALHNTFSTFIVVFAGLMISASILYQLLLPYMDLNLMMAYAKLIGLYKWLCAGVLTVQTALAVRRDHETAVHARPLIAAVVVFDSNLVMDRLLPLYEPVLGGWFIELGSFALMLMFGYVILKKFYRQTTEQVLLEENLRLMDQSLSVQQEQYALMTDALKGERAFRHDLRHHLSVMLEYAQTGNREAFLNYFEQLEHDVPDIIMPTYCENTAVDALIRHYAARARHGGAEFHCDLGIKDYTALREVDLCVILGNCLENAVEACQRQRVGTKYVRLRARQVGATVSITIDNSFDGSYKRRGEAFHSRKGRRLGIGLSSVSAAAKKYKGSVSIDTERTEFRVSVVLYLCKKGVAESMSV